MGGEPGGDTPHGDDRREEEVFVAAGYCGNKTAEAGASGRGGPGGKRRLFLPTTGPITPRTNYHRE